MFWVVFRHDVQLTQKGGTADNMHSILIVLVGTSTVMDDNSMVFWQYVCLHYADVTALHAGAQEGVLRI